jgi:hypothetical protein
VQGIILRKICGMEKIYGKPTLKMVLIATFSAWIGINGLLGLTILLG